jgi:hypothetical protein
VPFGDVARVDTPVQPIQGHQRSGLGETPGHSEGGHLQVPAGLGLQKLLRFELGSVINRPGFGNGCLVDPDRFVRVPGCEAVQRGGAGEHQFPYAAVECGPKDDFRALHVDPEKLAVVVNPGTLILKNSLSS